MAKIYKDRMFASMDGDFVVFLIGMRVNNIWKIHKWLPPIFAMPKMLKELFKNPGLGFLGANYWFGRTTIMMQYWKSFEHLENYAKSKTNEHLPAWREFNMKIRQSGATGIWHETYKITKGSYENIYVNMPPFGLGKAGILAPVSQKYDNASERMKQ